MYSLLNSTETNIETKPTDSTETKPTENNIKKITILETAREKCNVYNCPRKRGWCTRDTRCTCYEGYLSVNDDSFPFYCNYEQKKQITAFLLEFFIGFGIGHLYNANVQLAMIKLLTFFTCYFILCFVPYFSAQTKSNCLNRWLGCFQTLAILTIVIWQIVDSVLLGIGYFKDGNGIPLLKWDYLDKGF